MSENLCAAKNISVIYIGYLTYQSDPTSHSTNLLCHLFSPLLYASLFDCCSSNMSRRLSALHIVEQ